MQSQFDGFKQSQNLIKKLLLNIEQTTESMNKTFEDTVLRHEQQFIKCYQLKITELVKMLGYLKTVIQDKFINNTLAIQLQTVIKQRDYFKYECLKLNSQHQTLLDDHKNITAQASNASQQLTIYKHLLETQKIKSNQIQNNVEKLKKNLNQITTKNLPEVRLSYENRPPEIDRQIIKLKRQSRQKTEVIRALKERVHQLQRNICLQHEQKLQKKQLYQLWRVCADGWRREISTKYKKQDRKLLSFEQVSITNKKQLLRLLFTHNQFLKFIQRLLFDDGFRVIFESTEEKYMNRNRQKLMTYMNKRRIYTSPKGVRI